MDPFGAEDLFSQFFGGGLDGLLGMAGPMLGPRRGRDTLHMLKVSLEDLYNGKLCKLQLSKTVPCGACGGSGAATGAGSQRVCSGCGGRGVCVTLHATPLGLMQQRQSACRECAGRGRILADRHHCTGCRGRKTTNLTKILDVPIEPGMTDGQRLTFRGEGNYEPGITPGDVIVVIQSQPHKTFSRHNHDLHMRKSITLTESLCGLLQPFTHLDNRTVVMSSKSGRVIRPGSTKCMRGEGFPVYGRPGQRGDLYVQFDVDFPASHWAGTEGGENLQERTCAALERLLPPRPDQPPPPAQEHCEDVHLEDYTPNTRSRESRREAYSEDERGHIHGMHPEVQCAHQ